MNGKVEGEGDRNEGGGEESRGENEGGGHARPGGRR